jgi:hypothetical protein
MQQNFYSVLFLYMMIFNIFIILICCFCFFFIICGGSYYYNLNNTQLSITQITPTTTPIEPTTTMEI